MFFLEKTKIQIKTHLFLLICLPKHKPFIELLILTLSHDLPGVVFIQGQDVQQNIEAAKACQLQSRPLQVTSASETRQLFINVRMHWKTVNQCMVHRTSYLLSFVVQVSIV